MCVPGYREVDKSQAVRLMQIALLELKEETEMTKRDTDTVKRFLLAVLLAVLILLGGMYYHVCTWRGCL